MIRARTSRFARIERKSSSGCGSSSRPEPPCGSAAQAIKTPVAPSMPAITKALRQPSSVPTRPNRNDSDAPMVNELVYHPAMRARVASSTPSVSARSPGIYMPAIALPAGPPVGQADQRDDGEHIASGRDPREPAGLRVGQRPGLDELWQQRRNDRESGQAENFGGAYGGDNRCRRRSRGRSSQSHGTQ